MAIKKAKVTSNYVTIPNSSAQDKNLSFEARGLLTLMLSMPDDWVMHRSWLMEQSCGCGRDKMTRILKELEDNGYLIRHVKQTETGKMNGWDWEVYPSPVNTDERENRHTENPSVGKPAPTKETSLQSKQNTKETLKDLSVSTKHDETVKNIFAVWCEKMNSPRSRLDANRKRLIANTLKKYTENDLIAAITGCAMSPFHMGMNPDGKKYNGLDLILRNAEKIEQFIGFSINPPAQRQQQAGYDFNDTSWVKDFGDTY